MSSAVQLSTLPSAHNNPLYTHMHWLCGSPTMLVCYSVHPPRRKSIRMCTECYLHQWNDLTEWVW